MTTNNFEHFHNIENF